MIVLGIDLSGRSTGVTAAAVLEGPRYGRPSLTTWEDHALNGPRGDARLVESHDGQDPAGSPSTRR